MGLRGEAVNPLAADRGVPVSALLYARHTHTSNNPVKYIDPSGHMPVNNGRVICNDAGQCYPAAVHSGGNFSPPSTTKQPKIKKGQTSTLENAIIHIPSDLFNPPIACFGGSDFVCPFPEEVWYGDFSQIEFGHILEEIVVGGSSFLGPFVDMAIEYEGEELNTLDDLAIDTIIDEFTGIPISSILDVFEELGNFFVTEVYCRREQLVFENSSQEVNFKLEVSYSEYLRLVQGGYLKEHSILNLSVEYP